MKIGLFSTNNIPEHLKSFFEKNGKYNIELRQKLKEYIKQNTAETIEEVDFEKIYKIINEHKDKFVKVEPENTYYFFTGQENINDTFSYIKVENINTCFPWTLNYPALAEAKTGIPA